MELASAYFGRGQMQTALEQVKIAISADPNYGEAYNLRGLIYSNLGENALAEESFKRALQINPRDGDALHNYGWFLCQTGREPSSIKYFLHAIRNPLYPTPWRSYSAAGFCKLKVNEVKDAEAFFERALKLEPDEPGALLHLGQIRYRQRHLGEARKLVARHNKLVTPSAESLWLALRIERRLGERVAEQAFANQLRRRHPASPEYEAMLRGQYD
jgi:type IV pilus assembly protein PilF